MRKFDYRSPRLTVDLPVRMTQGSTTHHGRCREISAEGMKVELQDPLVQGTSCAAHFDCEDLSFRLLARIVHPGPDSCGVKFVYESDRQRQTAVQLVKLLAAPVPCTALALLR